MFGVTDSERTHHPLRQVDDGILVLPLIIINAQEAIKAVPDLYGRQLSA